MPGPNFEELDPTDFEEFSFELLSGLEHVVNVDWRKGTPKPASPADRGRDIVAEVERVDIDGSKHAETWFVDCKHYDKGVPPEALQGLIAWAQAERPHVALVIASGFLSNPAKDWIGDYVRNNRPPFRIKHWERPQLDRLTRGNPELLERFRLGGMRTQSEIIEAEQEFFDRVWHERHLVGVDRHESSESRMTDEINAMALKAAERVRASRADIRPVRERLRVGHVERQALGAPLGAWRGVGFPRYMT
jgi:hypothetical protein